MQQVEEIFDASIHFIPAADPDRCRYCPYAQICGL
jgi:CRISPR/Cas system-associated exonuclease Cas4 (RecB family)